MEKEKPKIKITAGYVLSWIFGILFMFTGLGAMTMSPFWGVVIILSSAMILPSFDKFLERKFNIELSGGVKFILVIVIFIAFGFAISSTTKKIMEGNEVSVIDSTNTISTQSIDDDTTQKTTTQTSRKVKSATISVDRVTETAANLGPIRITVTNTGDVSFTPHFDVTVKSDSGNTVCEDSPMFGIDSIPAGQKKTDEIQIFVCIFNEDGDYTVNIDLLDEEYKKLDSDSKTLTVFYFGQFDEMLNNLD